MDEKDLKYIKKVSEGSFGVVYLGTYMENEVAIKVFKKRDDKINIDSFLKEVEILSGLKHRNIVLFMGICVSDSNYMIITEFMKKGSLHDIIYSKKSKSIQEKIPINRMLEIIIDVAKAMIYLHKREIFHCDLKSSNILMDKNWNIKLADFGLSRLRDPTSKIKSFKKRLEKPESVRLIGWLLRYSVEKNMKRPQMSTPSGWYFLNCSQEKSLTKTYLFLK